MSPIQKQLELSSAYFRVVGHVVGAQLRFATVLTQSMIAAPFAQVRALRAAAARPVVPPRKAAAPARAPKPAAPAPVAASVASAPIAAETPAAKTAAETPAAKTAVKATRPATPRPRKTRTPATPPAMPEPVAKG